MKTWRNASLAVDRRGPVGADDGVRSGAGHGIAQRPGGRNAAPAQQPAESGYGSSGGGYGSGADVAAPKAAGQLAVQDSKKLGKVLTDSEGFTLYRFDKDTAKPPKSNCDGDCAKAWPSVPAGDVTAAAGTDASLLGEVVRDRRHQAAHGRRLADVPVREGHRAGTTNGQGVGGTWFASAPDGKKAAANADGAAVTDPAAPNRPTRRDFPSARTRSSVTSSSTSAA